MKISSIYVDRFGKALKARGVDLKRAALIELLSTTLGYHNSGEFSAAAKRGDLTPLPAQPLGTVALPDGQRLIIVTDQNANSPYGIDESFIEHVVDEDRAELIGVTPYGHLAFLGDLTSQPIPDLGTAAGSPAAIDGSDMVSISRDVLTTLNEAADKYAEDLASGLNDGTYDDDPGLAEYEAAIKFGRQAVQSTAPTIIETDGTKQLKLFTASVDHRHGTNAYAATSPSELQAQLAEFCREFWSEVEEIVDEDIDTLTNAEIVSTYFDAHSTEFYDTGETTIEITPEILAQLGIAGQSTDPSSNEKPGNARDSIAQSAPTPIMLLEWLSDEFGNPLPGVSHDDLSSHDLTVLDRSELYSRYPGCPSSRVGFAVKHEGEVYHVIEIKKTWDWGDDADLGQAHAEADIIKLEKALLDPVTQLGGTLLLDSRPVDHAMTLYILLPFQVSKDATTIDDYYAAIDYLINGQFVEDDKRKQVFAEFRGQAWVNDYAVPVDPVGETKLDVTFELLMLGHERAADIENDDYTRDDLRHAIFAPRWTLEHTGPFEVDIEQGDIDELFTIIRPAKTEKPEIAKAPSRVELIKITGPVKAKEPEVVESQSDDESDGERVYCSDCDCILTGWEDGPLCNSCSDRCKDEEIAGSTKFKTIDLPGHYEIRENGGKWNWYERCPRAVNGEGLGYASQYEAKLAAQKWHEKFGIDEKAFEGDPDSIELPDHYEIHVENGEWSWFEMNGFKTDAEGHGFKTEYAAKLDAKCWADQETP